MNHKDQLDLELYNIYNDENSKEYKLERLKTLADRYNTNIYNLQERYDWLIKMNINPNIHHLEENHNLLYQIFDEYNKMLNENNIEYYYTSGILAYLLVDRDLERYHHDIDIFINMKDLKKLETICNKYNFSFERKIGERGDGTQRIMLKMYYDNKQDIPITVFMYIREPDNSIIQKDYFVDQKGLEYVEYIYNSSLITELSFSNTPNFHNNIAYYSITLEALYLCKTGNRPKDIYDCNIFKDNVSQEKLKKLKDGFKDNLANKVIDAKEDLYSEYIFRTPGKKKVLKKND